MGRACSTYGEKRGAYGVLVGTHEGRRPLGRPRRRWDGSIKMDVEEVGWGGGHVLDRSDLGQGQVTGFR